MTYIITINKLSYKEKCLFHLSLSSSRELMVDKKLNYLNSYFDKIVETLHIAIL